MSTESFLHLLFTIGLGGLVVFTLAYATAAMVFDARLALEVRSWLFIGRRFFGTLPHSIRHTILRPAFWLGLTLSFPLEHFFWERLWPFYIITRWLGL